MAGEEGQSRWVFTQNELSNTPSRKSGVDADKELSYRQQAANFIQDMGQRLQVYPTPLFWPCFELGQNAMCTFPC